MNDLVLFAPGALLDEPISWKTLNSSQVQATLTKHDISVSATLTFDKKGQLINFESTDRYDFTDASNPIKAPWSTPIHAYGQFGPYALMAKGEAIWHYPKGDFTYITLEPVTIEIN